MNKRKTETETETEKTAALEAAGCVTALSGVGCITVFLLVPTAVWRGFVVSCLWAWFAETAGAPHLGWARAVGLSLILGLYTSRGKASKQLKRFFLAFAVSNWLAPFVALALGFAASRFL